MIRILFFAQTRELIGVPSLDLDVESMTIADLIDTLILKGDNWRYALKEKQPLCAVNKQLVEYSYMLKPHDEVAFFPPVTGG